MYSVVLVGKGRELEVLSLFFFFITLVLIATPMSGAGKRQAR